MQIPDATAFDLRNAGRLPVIPCRIALANGQTLILNQLLRVLPSKRITSIGELAGQTIIAKLFIDPRHSERHWQRERQGVESLQHASLPTPPVHFVGRLANGGHCILSEFIENAQSFADMDALTLRIALPRLFALLGRMHAHGLIHDDAHLGNFLWRENAVWILDGDAIRVTQNHTAHLRNLALLLAQLPPTVDDTITTALCSAYAQGSPYSLPPPKRIQKLVDRIKRQRLRSWLKKTLRDCSQFSLQKSFRRFAVTVRDEADFLAPILNDPDRWLHTGEILKAGRTATLAKIQHAGRQLVIKRYNIKSPWHALSRCWRPSRAWHAWLAAHRLIFFGIATPQPLALIERRLGFFRREAWLITTYCSGRNIADFFNDDADAASFTPALHAVQQLFQQLYSHRIVHGDLKATNLLWHDGQPILIDLDATRQYQCPPHFQRAWHKDRQRFLRNWQPTSSVYASLDTLLPPGSPV